MANIVLKDKNGANIVYKNVDYVSFQTPEGRTVRFNERAAAIISVTELPTEDINDNAIYRLTTKDDDGKTTVEFYAHENSGEWIEVAEGAKMSDLEITKNGEYTPVEAEDGFAKVKVNIDTFTDVAELPIENIDEDAIYRVITKDADTGSVVIVNAELVTAEAGEVLGKVFNYIVVDELPAIDALEAPTTDDVGIVTANAYILKNTGVPYYTAIDDAGILFLAEMGLLSEYEFKGMLPAEVTESGMYSTITVGTTYTTYGLLDANNTKTVLEFTADEGWIECGAGGAEANPIEITANGIYDETSVVDIIGKVKPDNMARYVFRNKIEKEVLAELMTYAKPVDASVQGFDAMGMLYTFEDSNSGAYSTAAIMKSNNEYMLMIMLDCDNSDVNMYMYCTNDMYFSGQKVKAGWNIINFLLLEMLNAANLEIINLDEDMVVTMLLPEYTLAANIKEGIFDFFRNNLLSKKVDMDVPHSCAKVDGAEECGTVAMLGQALPLYPSVLDITPEQVKELPACVLGSPTISRATTTEPALQYLMTDAGFKLLINALGSMEGTPPELLEMLRNFKPIMETDAYIFVYMLEAFMVYVKDLNAAGAEDLVGDFEEGKWYCNGGTSNIYLQPYVKGVSEAFAPVRVNIPNAGTIVDVKELPTEDIDSSKIYKKVDRGPTNYKIMANVLGGPQFSDIVSLISYMSPDTQYTVTFVDKAPTSFTPSTDTEKYLYCVLSTGEVLCSTDGINANASNGIMTFNPDKFLGVIADPDYVPEDTGVSQQYYFLMYHDETITYGLPSQDAAKQYVEFNNETSAWEKLGSGDLLMSNVEELPTENIDNNKVYCVKDEIEELLGVYIAATNSNDGSVQAIDWKAYIETLGAVFGAEITCEYHVVDTLPENPIATTMGGETSAMHIYIVRDTGEQYIYDGSTYVIFCQCGIMGDSSNGEYFGKISDPSEAVGVEGVANAYYTIMRDASVSYTYGIPAGDNKTVYKYIDGRWSEDAPIVTELSVTKNGVYENPTVKVPCSPANVVPGAVLHVQEAPTVSSEAIEQLAGYANPETGYAVVYDDGTIGVGVDLEPSGDSLMVMFEIYDYASNTSYVYLPEDTVTVNGGDFWNAGWTTPGWYHYSYDNNTGSLTEDRPNAIRISQNFDESELVWLKLVADGIFTINASADGYNKVTVNVPSHTVDTTTLPTENVDTSKVYRLMEENITEARYYINNGSTINTIEQAWINQYGTLYFAAYYILVDELPSEDSVPPITQDDLIQGAIPTYVSKTTGEAKCYGWGAWWPLERDLAALYNDEVPPFNGIVYSVDDMTEPGYYALFTREQNLLGYGIANDSTSIMVYKNGAWVRFVEEVVASEEPTDPDVADSEGGEDPAEPTEPENGDGTDPEVTDPEVTEPTDPETT